MALLEATDVVLVIFADFDLVVFVVVVVLVVVLVLVVVFVPVADVAC